MGRFITTVCQTKGLHDCNGVADCFGVGMPCECPCHKKVDA